MLCEALRRMRMIDRIRDVMSFLKTAFLMLRKGENKEAAKHILSGARKILSKVAPRSGSGYVKFGTGDPYDTGRVMEVLAFLYPLYGERIEVIPVFDEAFLESKMDVKGRFRLSQILFPLISMNADRNVRNFIKEVRTKL